MGVQSGAGARGGSSDGLTVGGVCDVAASKDTGDVSAGGGVRNHHIAGSIQLQLVTHQLAARLEPMATNSPVAPAREFDR